MTPIAPAGLQHRWSHRVNRRANRHRRCHERHVCHVRRLCHTYHVTHHHRGLNSPTSRTTLMKLLGTKLQAYWRHAQTHRSFLPRKMSLTSRWPHCPGRSFGLLSFWLALQRSCVSDWWAWQSNYRVSRNSNEIMNQEMILVTKSI